MRDINYLQAMNEAIAEEMIRDDRVIVIGEDVRAGVFGVTAGLLEKFGPRRILDTPISESGFCGAAIGAAMRGLRPVVNMHLGSFLYVAMDQIVNECAKLRYMFGGQVNLPIVFLCRSGPPGNNAAQHSDAPYPLFANSPGLKVVLPSTSYDVKGLLKQAIRDNDPVMVFGNIRSRKSSVPETGEDLVIPFGKGEVKRAGTDITVVAFLHLVEEGLSAAEDLEREGISLEVVDPRTLVPLDMQIILKSLAKTGRLLVTDDSHRTCGAAAEIVARVAEKGWNLLKAPVKRVTRYDVPIPYYRAMEQFVLPNRDKIKQAARKLMGV